MTGALGRVLHHEVDRPGHEPERLGVALHLLSTMPDDTDQPICAGLLGALEHSPEHGNAPDGMKDLGQG